MRAHGHGQCQSVRCTAIYCRHRFERVRVRETARQDVAGHMTCLRSLGLHLLNVQCRVWVHKRVQLHVLDLCTTAQHQARHRISNYSQRGAPTAGKGLIMNVLLTFDHAFHVDKDKRCGTSCQPGPRTAYTAQCSTVGSQISLSSAGRQESMPCGGNKS